MDKDTPTEYEAGNKDGRLKAGFVFAVFLIGALLLPYVLSLDEPARILLLGVALVALAVWGRRYLVRPRNP